MSASVSTAAAVSSAVAALLKWKEAQSATQKLQLIPDDEFFYLILTLKKIPVKARINAYKIPLPHPLHSSADLCLIVDDRPGAKPTSESIKEIIKAQNLPIAKLIKLSKLKANYKPFEAKRKLCGSYDLFMADKKIVHFLPKLLGGTFFKRKKLPVPIDMGKNWKGMVEKAGSFALLYFRTGTCSVLKVGKVDMERGEIEENVREAIDRVVEFVPKKWDGVRSFHLKVAESVALPLYQALPDMKLRIEGVRKEDGDVGEVEKVGSLKGDVEGSEKKSGGKKKDKGRIHEVRYMDVGLGEEEFVGQEEFDVENEVEVSDDEGEKSDGDNEVEVSVDEGKKIASGEFVGKKRKKRVVECEANENESVHARVNKAKNGKGTKSQVVTPMDVEKPAKKGRKEEMLKPVKEPQLKKESVTKKENKTIAKKTQKVEVKKVEKVEGVKPKKVTSESVSKKETKKRPLVAKSKTKKGSTKPKEKKSKMKVKA